MAKHMMSLAQAAAALGITRQTVRRRIVRGDMRAIRVGRAWAVTPAEVARQRTIAYRPGRKGRGG